MKGIVESYLFVKRAWAAAAGERCVMKYTPEQSWGGKLPLQVRDQLPGGQSCRGAVSGTCPVGMAEKGACDFRQPPVVVRELCRAPPENVALAVEERSLHPQARLPGAPG